MTTAYDRALEQTLGFEGDFANQPLDRGGRTMHGITQRTYDSWRLTVGRPKRKVELVEHDEIYAILHDLYWEPCGCASLPDDLAAAVFDMAVNSGPWNAKLTLQRALRVRADGVIGIHTIAAAKNTPDAVLLFLKKRGGYLQEVISVAPNNVAFLEGWINRLLDQAWKGGAK